MLSDNLRAVTPSPKTGAHNVQQLELVRQGFDYDRTHSILFFLKFINMIGMDI